MINLLAMNRTSMAAIVFLAFVWLPLRNLKKAVGNIVGVFSGPANRPELAAEAPPCVAKLLPACGFEDVLCGGGAEEVCSICLVEFVGEDSVSRLRRCGHVFHLECIENWVDRNRFTCPLCRSFIFCAL